MMMLMIQGTRLKANARAKVQKGYGYLSLVAQRVNINRDQLVVKTVLWYKVKFIFVSILTLNRHVWQGAGPDCWDWLSSGVGGGVTHSE
jgi:hypothetical protein